MTRRRGDHDDSLDEEYDDPEAPDAADQGADDEPETVSCPFCGRALVEEAEICPRCGNFIGATDDARTTRTHPRWVIVTTLVLLAAIALGVTFYLRWW